MLRDGITGDWLVVIASIVTNCLTKAYNSGLALSLATRELYGKLAFRRTPTLQQLRLQISPRMF
jgi:hypothetical protein